MHCATLPHAITLQAKQAAKHPTQLDSLHEGLCLRIVCIHASSKQQAGRQACRLTGWLLLLLLLLLDVFNKVWVNASKIGFIQFIQQQKSVPRRVVGSQHEADSITSATSITYALHPGPHAGCLKLA